MRPRPSSPLQLPPPSQALSSISTFDPDAPTDIVFGVEQKYTPVSRDLAHFNGETGRAIYFCYSEYYPDSDNFQRFLNYFRAQGRKFAVAVCPFDGPTTVYSILTETRFMEDVLQFIGDNPYDIESVFFTQSGLAAWSRGCCIMFEGGLIVKDYPIVLYWMKLVDRLIQFLVEKNIPLDSCPQQYRISWRAFCRRWELKSGDRFFVVLFAFSVYSDLWNIEERESGLGPKCWTPGTNRKCFTEQQRIESRKKMLQYTNTVVELRPISEEQQKMQNRQKLLCESKFKSDPRQRSSPIKPNPGLSHKDSDFDSLI
jgi:hypothetical protein